MGDGAHLRAGGALGAASGCSASVQASARPAWVSAFPASARPASVQTSVSASALPAQASASALPASVQVSALPASASALCAALVVALALASVTGCVGSAPERPLHGEPPLPLPEIVSGPPVPGMVWVRGAWHWDGVSYVWVPGRWESPPPTPGGT